MLSDVVKSLERFELDGVLDLRNVASSSETTPYIAVALTASQREAEEWHVSGHSAHVLRRALLEKTKLRILRAAGCGLRDDWSISMKTENWNSGELMEVDLSSNPFSSGLHLSALLARKDKLRVLQLEGIPLVEHTREFVITLGDAPNLEELSLARNDWLYESLLVDLLRCCGRLKSLNVSSTSVAGTECFSVAVRSLKTLSLAGCDLEWSEDLLNWLSNLGDVDVSATSLSSIPLLHLLESQIRVLRVHDCVFEWRKVAEKLAYSMRRNLRVDFDSEMKEKILQYSASCAQFCL